MPWVNSALWCGRSPVRNPGGTPIFGPLPFWGDSLETKKGAWELGLTMYNTSYSLTLTVHNPTKSSKGKWRKCARSDNVIEAGLIWERNSCPGSDTRVACHGWTVHCGAGGPRFETQGGTPIFGPLPFRGDSLETKKGTWELGLKEVKILFLCNRQYILHNIIAINIYWITTVWYYQITSSVSYQKWMNQTTSGIN